LSVTKKRISHNVSQKLKVSKKLGLEITNTFFNFLIINKEKNISINNFGSFDYKKTPKRIGRNPKTLQQFNIEARQKLTFKPSDVVKKNIN
tara:strand:- start:1303 stop:1575 length:273 start_codon:yes stop_codon:yes gene_type:complete